VPRAKRSILPDAAPKSQDNPMPTPEATLADLTRENGYLKQRNAQLQEDVTALGAEAERLRQIVERLHARTPSSRPNPLSGGQ
jgi:hypothetical protein